MAQKRFVYCTDSHGDLIHDESAQKLMAFCDGYQPHYRVHGGDFIDLACLRGGASPEDKAHGVIDDYHAGMKFLRQYRPTHLTLGNHDDRLWGISENFRDGIIREHCSALVKETEAEFKRLKIEWCKYEVGIFLKLPCGGPKFTHGFSSAQVSTAHKMFHKWGSVISGHVHKPDTYTATHCDGGMAMVAGCIGDIEKMTYANRFEAKMGWRNGFIYGTINDKTGKWFAWHVIKDDGQWISPMGIL